MQLYLQVTYSIALSFGMARQRRMEGEEAASEEIPHPRFQIKSDCYIAVNQE
ncbi:MAG: hypothetical protein Fur005_41840 [Roseiflexaceae bacterium]